jgi:prepilin-type N-terminal cleavage/methylation domain-containing protein/prepilin-type processing-associated H-X9-DG protein
MRYIYKKSELFSAGHRAATGKSDNCCKGLTLIEILVVIAIIAMLLAILAPALRKVGELSKCMDCQCKLRQISEAWHMYLNENNERFYQNVNANLNYGGWRGIKGKAGDPNGIWPPYRPLNPCLELPTDMESEHGAEVFFCPADRGGFSGALVREKVYRAVGTSYQTNIFLIGQNKCGAFSSHTAILDAEISKRLPDMTCTRASRPSLLLLVGDYGWINQWQPKPHPVPEWKKLAEWHGRKDRYNLAFLDGHVSFLEIQKGFYVTDKYSVIPFADLYGLARKVQGPDG